MGKTNSKDLFRSEFYSRVQIKEGDHKLEIVYEPAKAEDIDMIFSFSKEEITSYENLEKLDYDKILEQVYQDIRDHIKEHMRIVVDGEAAGYFYFHSADRGMELDNLYLFPAYRNRGIGTAVIRKCCSETSGPVFLYVFSKNTEALRLYERLGFCIMEKRRGTQYLMGKGQF